MHTTHACTMVLVLDLASPKAGIGAPAAGFYFHWNKFLRDRVWAVVSNPMIAGDRPVADCRWRPGGGLF